MERWTRNSDQVSFQDTTTIVSQLFDRYDVDDSGTMVRRCLSRRLLRGFVVQNDSDELVQLSVNVCFKLNLHTLQAAEVLTVQLRVEVVGQRRSQSGSRDHFLLLCVADRCKGRTPGRFQI